MLVVERSANDPWIRAYSIFFSSCEHLCFTTSNSSLSELIFNSKSNPLLFSWSTRRCKRYSSLLSTASIFFAKSGRMSLATARDLHVGQHFAWAGHSSNQLLGKIENCLAIDLTIYAFASIKWQLPSYATFAKKMATLHRNQAMGGATLPCIQTNRTSWSIVIVILHRLWHLFYAHFFPTRSKKK